MSYVVNSWMQHGLFNCHVVINSQYTVNTVQFVCHT